MLKSENVVYLIKYKNMQEIYKFNPKDFDEEGFSKTNNKSFLYFIEKWEKDFHKCFSPLKATHFYSNQNTMSLIDKILSFENYRCGMDLIDGKLDEVSNLKMDEFSKHRTIYAMNSVFDEDEPLYFVIDERFNDVTIMLKYINDSGGEDDEDMPNPIDVTKKMQYDKL